MSVGTCAKNGTYPQGHALNQMRESRWDHCDKEKHVKPESLGVVDSRKSFDEKRHALKKSSLSSCAPTQTTLNKVPPHDFTVCCPSISHAMLHARFCLFLAVIRKFFPNVFRCECASVCQPRQITTTRIVSGTAMAQRSQKSSDRSMRWGASSPTWMS
jgi:hypothetical protein